MSCMYVSMSMIFSVVVVVYAIRQLPLRPRCGDDACHVQPRGAKM